MPNLQIIFRNIQEDIMIYKRATQALQDAGIENIQIVKYLWGPAPEDTRAINSRPGALIPGKMHVMRY